VRASAREASRGTDRLLLFLCCLVLGVTVLYPALRLGVQAATHWQSGAILRGAGVAAIRNTLLLSLASVLCAGLVGSTLAVFLTRYSFPGRGVLSALAYLPFTLPPLVGVLSFYYLIGRDGVLLRLLQYFGLDNAAVPGPWAILLIHTYSFYVFFYAMVSAALETLDRGPIEGARTLGAGRLRVFFRVTVPMLLPAVLGAALLTFMSSGASFSAPYFFGGDFPMLSVVIFNERSQFNNDAAVTLTVVLGLVSLGGVLLFRGARAAGGVASKGVRVPIRGRAGRVLAAVVAWLCVVVVLIPHVTIVWLSFVSYRDWHTEMIPWRMTLENYGTLFREVRAFRPILNSLWMSGLATAATLVVGLPAAYLIARRRPGCRWLNILVMIPWALPGTVIAMNLIVAFNDRWLPVYNTVWMLPLAYFVRSVPLLTRMAGAVIEPFDATLIEAGRTLGAPVLTCFRRIVLPLIAPAVAAGMALVFAMSLGEFVASILLYLPGNIPIAVQINMEWRASVGAAFAYSVLLMGLAGAAFGVSGRFGARLL